MREEAPAIKISDAPGQDPAAIATMQRDLVARLASASLADAVGLLVRSERHRYYALADLEWLLLPALALGQIIFAYQRVASFARPSAKDLETAGAAPLAVPPMATAMLTWALVSPEVGAKIEAQKKTRAPVRLAPQEWRSGKELCIIEAIGSTNELATLTATIREQVDAVKTRTGSAA